MEHIRRGSESPSEMLAAGAAILHLPRVSGKPGPIRRRLTLHDAAGNAREAADVEAEAVGVGEGVEMGTPDLAARGRSRDALSALRAGQEGGAAGRGRGVVLQTLVIVCRRWALRVAAKEQRCPHGSIVRRAAQPGTPGMR